MTDNIRFYSCAFLVTVFVIAGCSVHSRLADLKKRKVRAAIELPCNEIAYNNISYNNTPDKNSDTTSDCYEDRGFVMNAVVDESTGETVVSDRINEVVVEAPYKSVAERNGYVDILFDIKVPKDMLYTNWQLRFVPTVYFLNDSIKLNKIYITGSKYRMRQMRGYELYNRFVQSIFSMDDRLSNYCYVRLLEIFLKRNYREIYGLKTDSLLYDCKHVEKLLGEEGMLAVEHYTKQWLVKRNNKRLGRVDLMRRKYIKSPIDTLGLRLDTVLTDCENMLVYRYVQRLPALPKVKRIDLSLDCRIFESDKLVYVMPPAGKLQFYISSLNWFVDTAERFLKRIVERNACFNTAAYIDFKAGEYRLIDTLSNNAFEIGRIKGNIRQMFENRNFVMDSIIVTSGCSPEGTYANNVILAKNRGETLKKYLWNYCSYYMDSLKDNSFEISIDNAGLRVEPDNCNNDMSEIFRVKYIPENWEKLFNLVRADGNVSHKDEIFNLMNVSDYDLREKKLARHTDYRYIRSVLYPMLRCVKFDFFMHRRGMIKDTLHTTVPDTLYMNGVSALLDKDYIRALDCLKGYKDYNTAIAYLCMDYNNSAIDILESVKQSPRALYMLAVAYMRVGDMDKAARCLKQAVDNDPSLIFRVNLDPEAQIIVQRYNLKFENNLY